MVEISEIQKT